MLAARRKMKHAGRRLSRDFEVGPSRVNTGCAWFLLVQHGNQDVDHAARAARRMVEILRLQLSVNSST
jgi:hypothetical protein